MATRTVPLLHIPSSLLANKNATDAVRSLAAVALNEGLPLVAATCEGLDRRAVFIPPALETKIEKKAKEMGWGFQETVASLCAAAIDHLAIKREQFLSNRDHHDAPPFQARNGQDVYYKSIMTSIEAGRICLAEASTGSGKSRAMVAAAITAAKTGRGPVVIAAPTLAILGGSLWTEFEGLRSHGLGQSTKAIFFPGASEFVDHEKLERYLSDISDIDEMDDPAVRQWVEQGGPVLNETPLARAMGAANRQLCWLMSDLRQLATNLDPGDFVCNSRKIPGSVRELIDAVRAEAHEADIIFCTHAMLSLSQLLSWELFPKPSVLIIDEAHMLEPIIAGINSHRLSLYSFRHDLRVALKSSGKGKSSAIGKAESAVNGLIAAIRSMDEGVGNQIRMSVDSMGFLADALAKLKDAMSSRSLADIPRIADARDAICGAIKIAVGEASSGSSFGLVEFSPDRRFPSLMVGQKSIGGILGSLWKAADGGVVLASATLATPDEFGNAKFDYVAGVLALPASRIDLPPPMVAPWTTSIPVIHMPREFSRLVRPASSERTDEKESTWLNNLAEEISAIAQKALGGTMVLMTSYSQLKILGESLAGKGLGNRVIAMNGSEKFAAFEARYREAHKAGQRPILLALGVAWTGVDLTDKTVKAEDDKLLTDLVIGCLPVGLNRSSTMASRIEIMGVNPIIKEAIMVFRQGIGRAVRSEHAQNKNIWVLDGRVWSDWNGMRLLQLSIRRILEKYQKRVSF